MALVIQMSEWSRNGEGYADKTAGTAIGRVLREERKIAMAKKRSCRRTNKENIIHEKAVKMRKMTDEQLVHYVEDRVEKARSEGFNRGKSHTPEHKSVSVERLVNEIGNIKGIGTTKLADIQAILERNLRELV